MVIIAIFKLSGLVQNKEITYVVDNEYNFLNGFKFRTTKPIYDIKFEVFNLMLSSPISVKVCIEEHSNVVLEESYYSTYDGIEIITLDLNKYYNVEDNPEIIIFMFIKSHDDSKHPSGIRFMPIENYE